MNRILNRLHWELCRIGPIRNWVEIRGVSTWLKNGKVGATPHRIKQANLLHFQKSFAVQTLVETGTCRADMLWALKSAFNKLISIELSEDLYNYLVKRCSGFSHIDIRQGDSATEIAKLSGRITGKSNLLAGWTFFRR